MLGNDAIAVYSSRGVSKGERVYLVVGSDILRLAGNMTPANARALAGALIAAAEASETMRLHSAKQPNLL